MLDRPLTQEEAADKMIATFYDQLKKPNELRPEAKAQCYQLLATTFHMANPHPIENSWFNFGFCTCHNAPEEGRLGGLYQRLPLGDRLFENVSKAGIRTSLVKPKLQTATFAEFWHAYESGTLIRLMDLKV
jgi:hypothetical protein